MFLFVFGPFTVRAASDRAGVPPEEKTLSTAKSGDFSEGSTLSELPGLGETLYFGLYFQGRKVGWMSQALTKVPEGFVQTSVTDFSLVVAGMTTRMTTTDSRVYDAESGDLTRFRFAMDGATGSLKVRGRVEGADMLLHTESGGREFDERAPFPGENLLENLSVERRIVSGKVEVGDEFKTATWDPSLKKALEVRSRVAAVENRSVYGVETRLVRVDGRMESLGLPIVSWYDGRGRLMETLVAGMLKARLEDEETARSGRSVADFLESSRVPVPRPLTDPQKAAVMVAELEGVPENLAIDDERQRWTTLPSGSRRVTVTLPPVDPARTPASGTIDPRPFVEELDDTPRVQKNDPAVRKVAFDLRKSAGRTTGELARALNDWVFRNLKKTYTPTFSNASEAMKTREGDCGEHAVLLAALCRAVDIPAREVAGLIYAPKQKAFYYHAWTEVWIGSWVAADPSWGQFPADVTHVAFAKGGVSEQVRVVTLVANLKILSARTMSSEPR